MNGVPIVKACPNCDSAKIAERVTKTPRFRCDVCGERFEQPTTRANKNHTFGSPDATVDAHQYQSLVTALRRTREAGSSHAQSKLIAQYSDELSAKAVAQLCTRYAEARGDVERYREGSAGIVWRIVVDERAASEQEATA